MACHSIRKFEFRDRVCATTRQKSELAEETDQFPDDVGEHRPEHGKKPDQRDAAPGDLRNRQALQPVGARLMASAEAPFDSAAVASLPGGPQIQARSLVTCGRQVWGGLSKRSSGGASGNSSGSSPGGIPALTFTLPSMGLSISACLRDDNLTAEIDVGHPNYARTCPSGTDEARAVLR